MNIALLKEGFNDLPMLEEEFFCFWHFNAPLGLWLTDFPA